MKKISILVFISSLVLVSNVFAVGTNGSFETGITEVSPGFNTITSPDGTSITDWTVDSGSVDYIGSYWPALNGVRSIDLNGLAAGSISQVVPTFVGATYNITFDLSGNPENQVSTQYTSPSNKIVRVSATGATYQDFSYDTSLEANTLSDMKWKSQSYSFVATGTSTTLTFASQITGAFGPAIDNIFITETLPAQCDDDATQTIVSDASTQFNGGNSTVIDGSMLGAGILPPGAWANIPDASWIWGTNGSIDDTTVPTTEVFTRSFNIIGTPISASIDLSTDNGYILKVNGSTVDTKNTDPADEFNYKTVHTYDVMSYVTTGTNTLEISVTNFGRPSTTFQNNPGGLIYKLTINNNECVTPPPPNGSLTVTKNTVGGDGMFAFTGVSDGFSITTTAGTGSTTINNLIPGAYSVSESAATGWNLTSNGCENVTVVAGQTATCTIVNTKQSSISGMKYNDLDRDGIKDENESGLQSWVIRLILDNDLTDEDTVVATTTTDASGNYSFTNVAPGTYEVRETHQKGWKRMSKNPKDIVITAGSDITGVNFGNAVKQKKEKEDTDKDDNCDEQQGHYDGNHNGSNYENDQNNGGHENSNNDKPKNDKPKNDKPENDKGHKGDGGEKDD